MTIEAGDAFAVELGHEFGAPHLAPGHTLPRDEDREGSGSASQEQPGRRASPRREEPPGAGDGSREEGESESPEHARDPQLHPGLPVETLRALGIYGGE